MTEQRERGGTSSATMGAGKRWLLLALLVWIAWAALVFIGGADPISPLALVAVVLLAVGLVRAGMDWAVKNFSPRQG